MPEMYIPTSDNVLPDSKMGSTTYEIVMLSVSGVILLITAVAVLVAILRKYWKKRRSLEDPSTGAVMMVTFSRENSRNGISAPDLSSQAHIACICEVVDKKCRDMREQRDASLGRSVECFINDIHVTI